MQSEKEKEFRINSNHGHFTLKLEQIRLQCGPKILPVSNKKAFERSIVGAGRIILGDTENNQLENTVTGKLSRKQHRWRHTRKFVCQKILMRKQKVGKLIGRKLVFR